METMNLAVAASTGPRPARVLVFTVDDGLFALPIDWVEAMLPRASVALHGVRDEAGRQQSFCLHGGEPAMLVDLRDAFGLSDLLGATARREVLVVRSPSFLVALPVDACVGIRDLDVEERPLVPSSLLRDGGFPVGHLVALDGKPAVILDPSHLLGAQARDALAPLVQRAQAFSERERRLEALWAEICEQPSDSLVRTYARLCSRNGRTRSASAARVVLRHLTGGGRLGDLGPRPLPAGAAPGAWESDVPGDVEATTAALVESQVPPAERFLRELICLAGERACGELIVPQGDGAEESRVRLLDGRVAQAHHRGERGRAAFKHLLASQPEHFYFVETGADPAETRSLESTPALIIDTLDALAGERRGRRVRVAKPE